jgi:pimeloyl-ACP methyl ester carboxylesterase
MSLHHAQLGLSQTLMSRTSLAMLKRVTNRLPLSVRRTCQSTLFSKRQYASHAEMPDIPWEYPAKGKTMQLPSGRTLGYHTYGDPKGTPLIYLHGSIATGLMGESEADVKIAKSLGFHLIAPDRQGIGLTSPNETQEIIDYPQEVLALADHLALDEFRIMTVGGGTGYALACAKYIDPARLKSVGIWSGLGPVECGFDSMGEEPKEATTAWQHVSKGIAKSMEARAHFYRTADHADVVRYEDAMRNLSGSDGLLQANPWDPDRNDPDVLGYRQMYAQGVQGLVSSMTIALRPWGFKLEDIKLPGIKFWYGTDDPMHTPAMGRYMSERLVNAVYTEFPGDGWSSYPPEISELVYKHMLDIEDRFESWRNRDGA